MSRLMKNKIIYILALIFAILVVFLLIITSIFGREGSSNMHAWGGRRIEAGSSVIAGFRETSRLIVLEIALEETIVLDESVGWLPGFLARNITEARFYANATFSTDLTLVSESDIAFDYYTNTFSIVVPHPQIEAIEISHEDTEVNSDTGWFQGDIELSLQEQNALQGYLIDNMRVMLLTEMLPYAREATISVVENQVRSFIQPILESEDINIVVGLR